MWICSRHSHSNAHLNTQTKCDSNNDNSWKPRRTHIQTFSHIHAHIHSDLHTQTLNTSNCLPLLYHFQWKFDASKGEIERERDILRWITMNAQFAFESHTKRHLYSETNVYNLYYGVSTQLNWCLSNDTCAAWTTTYGTSNATTYLTVALRMHHSLNNFTNFII